MSWWSRAWWLDFVITPLSLEYGLETVLAMKLPDALLMKESLANYREQERYHHWKYEQDHKDKKESSGEDPKKPKVMRSLKPSEGDSRAVNHALTSADNYTSFLMNSRGYQPNAVAK